MKTHSVKPSEINKKWIVVDAADQAVGRISSEIARVLMGKHKPDFVPYLDSGDNVVVINAEKVRFTGRKWLQKNYYWHTGYIGGIKSLRAEEMLERHPERIIERAVKGMLPKNKMGRHLMTNLRIYSGSEHPHAAQKPESLEQRTAGVR